MPVGQLITLGIGTPSTINLLALTGLSPSQVSSGGDDVGVVPIGPQATLVGNTVYALPARAIKIEWLSTGPANLDVSLDRVTWVTIATVAGAGLNFTNNVCALFLRPSDTVTVVCRKVRAKL